MADDPDMLAAEFALGVLEGTELAEAQRRMLGDREFAEEVRWWRYRLASMAEAAGSVEPSDDVWPAIERRLADSMQQDSGPAEFPARATHATPGLSGWNLAGALGGVAAVAAAVALFFAGPRQEPAVAPEPQGDRYIAQGYSEDQAIHLAGVVEPDGRSLSLQVSGFAPASGQAAELWVVPAGGAPVSLGLIPEEGKVARSLTEEERVLLSEGAVLAVTYEDAGSAPHAAPTSEILVISPLTKV